MKVLKTLSKILLSALLLAAPVFAQNPAQQNSSGSISTTASGCGMGNTASCVVLPLPFNNRSFAVVTISGGWSGTLNFIAGNSGFPFSSAIAATPQAGGTQVTTTSANGSWVIQVAGNTMVGVDASSISGVASVTITSSTAPISVVAGGGWSSTVACNTPDAFIYWLTSTTGSCDSGITTNTSGQLSATGGLIAVSDAIHMGVFSLIGNTTNPVGFPFSNSWGFLPPASASFTSWYLQPSTVTAPAKNSLLYADAPSSNISPLTPSTNSACAAIGTGASPSLVACGAAKTGQFSCATNATGTTCVISTTAVTAKSLIFVQESDTTTTGTNVGVTCNTSTVDVPTSRLLASSVPGTSFTINLGTVTTNPACFDFMIVN